MIVKNESAIIERCLKSLSEYVDCWVICDTGSTDGTQDIIRDLFETKGKPGELHQISFVNFEQARNEALDLARASTLSFDYLLFTDADMELVVADPTFGTGFVESAYRLIQRAGISYWNTRIVRRDPAIRYRGVTHEFVDVPHGKTINLSGAWFIDHASGSNRVDKFERDIRLLKGGLEQEPDNHRYWFYLAQSYRDAGRLNEAVKTYAKRVSLGGWEEESWYAQYQQARALLALGDEAGFAREAIGAYNRRPTRAEPLYILAKYYREKGQNEAALVYAEMGLSIVKPNNDVLFIEDYVYEIGLKEEYSIAGFYTQHKLRRIHARDYCEFVALAQHRWDNARGLARHNGAFYVEIAESILPSLKLVQIAFSAPESFSAGNVSLAVYDGKLYAHVRAVNYILSGGYVDTRGHGPPNTRNYLLSLDDDLHTLSSVEILPPIDLPPPAQMRYLGFEDARLFTWRGHIWSLTTTRHFEADESWRMMLARLEHWNGQWRLTDWRVLPHHQQHEKNWMPAVEEDTLRFIHMLDPVRVLDATGEILSETASPIVARDFSGGTNLLSFDDGWLCMIHEYTWIDRRRRYSHRFVWLDKEFQPCKLTRRLYFSSLQVEFAIGLAAHPHRPTLLVSFGREDVEAWIAEIVPDELRAALNPVAPYQLSAAAVPATPVTVAGIRTFDLFDTLIARRDPDPQNVFRIVEQRSGHPGFAAKRSEAEAQIFSSPYTLGDIYRRLVEAFGVGVEEAERLKALELAVEEENIFPIAETMRQLGPDSVIVSDMYHSEQDLRAILRRACDTNPARLIVSSHGKRSRRVWGELLAEGPVISHLGDNPVTDEASPKAAGIPARLTAIAHRTPVENELADQGFAPLANLVREARLTTWSEDSGIRQAQLAQIQVNFPLIFLANLHLLRCAREHGWDNILFSARDCFLWSRLYDDVRRRLTAAPTASYFYTGRVTRAHPSPDYLAYFTRLRTGKNNVVVDLCGTGWSLSRLIEQSPAPATDIFLLHQIELPHLIQWYSEHGRLAHPIDVETVIKRGPSGGDNDVLEDLNRALHPAVEDMRRSGDVFAPVLSAVSYDADAAALIRVHHAAFSEACRLVDKIAPDDCLAMMERDTAAAIVKVYARMGDGMLDQIGPLLTHKRREEPLVWDQLRKGGKAPATASGAPLTEEPPEGVTLFDHALALRDAGAHTEAATVFLRRASAGGDKEEAWCARWQAARELLTSGDEAGFVTQANAAMLERPHRAEPFHDLAKYYRERGQNDVALRYCLDGLDLRFPPPGDKFMIDPQISTIGLLSEMSIAGWYSSDRAIRARAADICEWLALAPHDDMERRWLARHNGTLYAAKATEMFPFIQLRKLDIPTPDRWFPTNPSIIRSGDGYLMAVKLVNYVINDAGYLDTQGRGAHVVWSIVVELDDALRIIRQGRVVEPSATPPVTATNYFGFEDHRLVMKPDGIWATSTVGQFGGGVRMFRARLRAGEDGNYHMVDWTFLPSHQEAEKNWMPILASLDDAAFVHAHGPTRLLDEAGRIIREIKAPIASDSFRGGSQYVPFNGGWLGVVHEWTAFRTNANRHYTHRLVWLNSDMDPRGVSRRFTFGLHRVEFVAGLAPTADKEGFVISFGVKDNESWLATISANDVWSNLQDCRSFSGEIGDIRMLTDQCKQRLP